MTRGMLHASKLEQAVRDDEIDTVLVAFPDLQGRLVGKRVTGMFEVEVEANRRCHADNAIAVEHDELALRKQLDVAAVVRSLELLIGCERREHDALQLLELLCVLGTGTPHDEPVTEPPSTRIRHTPLRLPFSV